MGNKKADRFVLDTNVLLPAMGATLAPLKVMQCFMTDRRVLEYTLEKGVLCATRETWAEFTGIALSPEIRMDMAPLRPTAMRQRQEFVEQLRQRVLFVEPVRVVRHCEDGKDTMFLQAAAAAQARYLITHDSDLLAMKQQDACQIIRPRVLLARLEGRPLAAPHKEGRVQP